MLSASVHGYLLKNSGEMKNMWFPAVQRNKDDGDDDPEP